MNAGNEFSLEECTPAERAIRCFENWSGTCVTIIDPSRRLLVETGTFRYKHRLPECIRAKALNESRCAQFCWHELLRRLPEYPRGGLKFCHAGICDWFMPVSSTPTLPPLVLVAGGRRCPDEIPANLPVYREPLEKTIAPTCPATSREELLLVHEGLSQLAARLQLFLTEQQGARHSDDSLKSPRRDAIHSWIDHNFHQPVTLGDCARHFFLSESRMSHVVEQETGSNFRDLLAARRIREAEILLLHSREPVSAIAARSGFSSMSSFLRTFKRFRSMPPLAYRKKSKF